VVLTIAGALMGHALLAWLFLSLGRAWELDWRGAVVLGGAMAMSSTAIVVKLMAERLELESEHGKRVMGVLLFQDLAVVPLLVLIPALGTGSSADGLFVRPHPLCDRRGRWREDSSQGWPGHHQE
jgi:CPA2 family monovalent cation:H+ antiporter-2